MWVGESDDGIRSMMRRGAYATVDVLFGFLSDDFFEAVYGVCSARVKQRLSSLHSSVNQFRVLGLSNSKYQYRISNRNIRSVWSWCKS